MTSGNADADATTSSDNTSGAATAEGGDADNLVATVGGQGGDGGYVNTGGNTTYVFCFSVTGEVKCTGYTTSGNANGSGNGGQGGNASSGVTANGGNAAASSGAVTGNMNGSAAGRLVGQLDVGCCRLHPVELPGPPPRVLQRERGVFRPGDG